MSEVIPGIKPLSQRAEEEVGILRAALEGGTGFELFFVGSPSQNSLRAAHGRISTTHISGVTTHVLHYGDPAGLDGLLADLLKLPTSNSGRLAVLVSAAGRHEELRAAWLRALIILNQQRNRLIKTCPHALVFFVENWVLEVAQSTAPDLWSVRSSVFMFGEEQDFAPYIGPSFFPPSPEELNRADYYTGLADALSKTGRVADQRLEGTMLIRAARAWILRGELERAYKLLLEEALPLMERIGSIRGQALSNHELAKILLHRGDYSGALVLLKERVIPLYEAIDDRHSKAVAMGTLAYAQAARGETSEALRTYQSEVLPIFESLGDNFAWADTMNSIAAILASRGDLDEALAIYNEKTLPIFREADSAYSVARTWGGIARILRARGDNEEALRILIEEQWPVFASLEDRRSQVSVAGDISRALPSCTNRRTRELAQEILSTAYPMAVALKLPESSWIASALELR